MKAKLISFIILVLTIFSTFSLSGCVFGFVNSDEDIAKKNTEKLVNVIQKKDREGIKALFAPNKISEVENFDKSIDELITYVDGEVVSFFNRGTGTFGDIDYGRVIKYHDMSNDVTTTAGVVRFYIKWYIEDNKDVGNVGIWSLYVIKFEDDPDNQYAYTGDGLGTIGINIGKIDVEI